MVLTTKIGGREGKKGEVSPCHPSKLQFSILGVKIRKKQYPLGNEIFFLWCITAFCSYQGALHSVGGPGVELAQPGRIGSPEFPAVSSALSSYRFIYGSAGLG